MKIFQNCLLVGLFLIIYCFSTSKVFAVDYYEIFHTPEQFFHWDIQQQGDTIYITDISWFYRIRSLNYSIDWNTPKYNFKNLLSFYVDKESNIWFSTFGNKFILFQKDSIEIDLLKKYKFELKNPIYRIECDSSGNLWFCTKEGVWELNRKTDVIRNVVPSESSELKDSIKSLMIDKNNVKWFCTRTGIYSYDDIKLKKLFIDTLSLNDPLNLFWMQMKFDKFGNKWFSSLNGLFKFDGNIWVNFNTINSNLTNDSLLDFDWDKEGKLWVATFRELIMTNLSDTCIIHEKYSPQKNPYYSLMNIWFDNYNNMWQVFHYMNIEDGPSYEVRLYNKDTITFTGLKELIYNSNNKVFPNPVSDYAQLKLDNEFFGFATISVVDLLGNTTQIYSGDVSGGVPLNLDLSAFPSGFYSLIIDYGMKREVVKVIKN